MKEALIFVSFSCGFFFLGFLGFAFVIRDLREKLDEAHCANMRICKKVMSCLENNNERSPHSLRTEEASGRTNTPAQNQGGVAYRRSAYNKKRAGPKTVVIDRRDRRSDFSNRPGDLPEESVSESGVKAD